MLKEVLRVVTYKELSISLSFDRPLPCEPWCSSYIDELEELGVGAEVHNLRGRVKSKQDLHGLFTAIVNALTNTKTDWVVAFVRTKHVPVWSRYTFPGHTKFVEYASGIMKQEPSSLLCLLREADHYGY